MLVLDQVEAIVLHLEQHPQVAEVEQEDLVQQEVAVVQVVGDTHYKVLQEEQVIHPQ